MTPSRRVIAVSALVALWAVSAVQAVEHPGPFSDVPIAHSAYVWADSLVKWGLTVEYVGCTGRRALTRYEFAVRAQRLESEVLRHVSAPAGSSPKAVSRPLFGTLTTPGRFRRAVDTLQKLRSEFEVELELVSSPKQVASRTAELQKVRDEAPRLLRTLRKSLRVQRAWER